MYVVLYWIYHWCSFHYHAKYKDYHKITSYFVKIQTVSIKSKDTYEHTRAVKGLSLFKFAILYLKDEPHNCTLSSKKSLRQGPMPSQMVGYDKTRLENGL